MPCNDYNRYSCRATVIEAAGWLMNHRRHDADVYGSGLNCHKHAGDAHQHALKQLESVLMYSRHDYPDWQTPSCRLRKQYWI